MAKFCTNCGAQIPDGMKFCPQCGTPVPGAAQPQSQPQQQARPQQPPVQPQYQQPPVQPQYQQPYQQPVKPKKKHGCLIAFLIFVLIIALGVVGYLGFRPGGWFRGKPSVVSAEHIASMRDYAKRLEEMGNVEAAQAVYDLIPQGGGAEMIQDVQEAVPVLGAQKDLDHLKSILGKKGGF